MSRFLVLVLALQLAACAEPGCVEPERIGRNAEKISLLVSWADTSVFGETLSRDQLESGGLVGPGRFKLKVESVVVPQLVGGWEIRPIGSNPLQPEGVFIGTGPYRGVLISRGSNVSSVMASEGILDIEVISRTERLAAICRPRG